MAEELIADALTPLLLEPLGAPPTGLCIWDDGCKDGDNYNVTTCRSRSYSFFLVHVLVVLCFCHSLPILPFLCCGSLSLDYFFFLLSPVFAIS